MIPDLTFKDTCGSVADSASSRLTADSVATGPQ